MLNCDFISVVKSALEEQGKCLDDLFNDKVISENTFYKYRQRDPSLETTINICNYLCVSIDYLLELKIENNYRFYSYSGEVFYNNIKSYLSITKLSGRKFCETLNYSKDNLLRWKSGTNPSLQTLLEIANYFKCTIDDLIL